MPWSLENRDGQWCVVKQGASDPVPGGCHSSRADAIKHQRALYANESRMASLYDELDAQTDEWVEPSPPEVVSPQTTPVMAEILALLAREQQEKSLVASVAEQQNLISQQFAEAQAERQALVAALGRVGSPTINVPAPNITVEAPEITVNPTPVTVEAPNITVESPSVSLPPMNVTVQQPDIVLPERTKTVTFERDPLTHEVTSAEVTET